MEENISGVTQTDAGSTETAPETPAAEEFESLIKGKYKKAYDERVQETVRKRLKNAGKATETLNALAQKYGITPEDIAALAKPGQMQAASNSRALEEINEVRRLYPGMDVRRELEDPKLRQLLQRGIDLRTAYEVVHRDEIIPAAMQAAARAVEKKLTGSAAVSRVAESAMESSCAAVVKTDVAAMTRQQRADIIRRAAKGEKIKF